MSGVVWSQADDDLMGTGGGVMPAESPSSRSRWMIGCGAGSDRWAALVTLFYLCLSLPPVARSSPGPVQDCGTLECTEALVKYGDDNRE